MLGEIRRHSKNGLYYIYERHPDNERRAWLRLDTFIWGKWRDFPNRSTTPPMLSSLSEKQQKTVLRKYKKSPSSIQHPKSSSRKTTKKACKSYSFSKCPSRCTPVKRSCKSRPHCRGRR